MNGFDSSDDQGPVTWVRGHPIFAAYLIVIVFVASMLATTILSAVGRAGILGWIAFDSANVLKGQVWRLFTYGFFNPPSLGFAIDMFMIGAFGREVEKFFGRSAFLKLYAGIYFIPPLLFTLIGLRYPRFFAGETGAFALFVAFATLYPDAVLLFNVLAKWVAIVLVGIYALMALSQHSWMELITLCATVGFAYGFVRYQQGQWSFSGFSGSRTKADRSRAMAGSQKLIAGDSGENPMAEIDVVLDKIARSGMASLTPKERAKLDSAREALAKRSSGRH